MCSRQCGQTGKEMFSVAAYVDEFVERGGRKSGTEGCVWLRNVIVRVCRRNWIATAISDAEGWCVKAMSCSVVPQRSDT